MPTSCPVGPLRILVVDDFVPFRETLCSFFLTYESMAIVGEAADGEAAIEMAFRLTPHVIIMDTLIKESMKLLDPHTLLRRTAPTPFQMSSPTLPTGLSRMCHPVKGCLDEQR
jgi:chemotaxis response regulator CheB